MTDTSELIQEVGKLLNNYKSKSKYEPYYFTDKEADLIQRLLDVVKERECVSPVLESATKEAAIELWHERNNMKIKLEYLAELYQQVDDVFENFNLYDASHIEGEDVALHLQIMEQFKNAVAPFLPPKPEAGGE